jgi:DNA-binding NarL/FixJ family response regulator
MSRFVLIAEKNELFIEALEITLSKLGFTVVGTTSKRSDINNLALKTKPDLLVFDFQLSNNGMAGLTEPKHLKEQLPEMKILVLSYQDTTNQFTDVIFNAGFDGCDQRFRFPPKASF